MSGRGFYRSEENEQLVLKEIRRTSWPEKEEGERAGGPRVSQQDTH